MPADSLGVFLELVEQLSNLGKLGRGDFFGGECAEDEVLGGAVECAVEEIAGEQLLRVLPGEAGAVDMGAEALAAFEQALFSHDLHLFEDGGVADLLAAEGVVDLAHGSGAGGPEDIKDGEFGLSGERDCRVGWGSSLHEKNSSTIMIVCQRLLS
jgi:hypothetical protein